MSVKVESWNVNGIRSAAKSGFFEWLEASQADVVLLQEVRADMSVLNPAWREIFGLKSVWFPAQKKGYSGVSIYTRFNFSPSEVVYGLGIEEFDQEGRFVGIIKDDVLFASVYFPNSQREGVRLPYKLAFCSRFLDVLKQYERQGLKIVVGGDINIAHTELDLANPKQNVKNAGFLPEERAWMSKFVDAGFIDTFRMFEKRGGFYSWWSNRPGIRERNIGWRLDYHFVSESLKSAVTQAKIQTNVYGSDHCPVSLELEWR